MIKHYHIRKGTNNNSSKYSTTFELFPTWGESHYDTVLGKKLAYSVETPNQIPESVYPYAHWESGDRGFYPIQVTIYTDYLPTEEKIEEWFYIYQSQFSILMEEAKRIEQINAALAK